MNPHEQPPSAPMPPENPLFFPIYRPKAGQCLRTICLSNSILGVLTHWIDGHEIPCLRTSGKCVCSAAPVQVRWTGFLCCVLSDVRARPAILPITDHAARQCPLLVSSAKDLRGLQIHYAREKGGECAKCWARIVEPTVSDKSIPPAFDLWHALITVWKNHFDQVQAHMGQS